MYSWIRTLITRSPNLGRERGRLKIELQLQIPQNFSENFPDRVKGEFRTLILPAEYRINVQYVSLYRY